MDKPLVTAEVRCRGRLHKLALYPGEAAPRLLAHDMADLPRLRNYNEIGGDIRCVQALDAFLAHNMEKVPAKLRPYVPQTSLWADHSSYGTPHTPEEALAQNIRKRVTALWMECDYRSTKARWPPGLNYVAVKITDRPFAFCQVDYHSQEDDKGPSVYFQVGVRSDWLQVVTRPLWRDSSGRRVLTLDRLTERVWLAARPGVGFEVYPWPARHKDGTLRWLTPASDECRIWVANHPRIPPGVQL